MAGTKIFVANKSYNIFILNGFTKTLLESKELNKFRCCMNTR